MPTNRNLKPLTATQLRSVPEFSTVREFSAKFPDRSVTAATLRSRVGRELLTSIAPVAETQPAQKRITAVEPSTTNFTRLRKIHESEAATAELVSQNLDEQQAVGLIYSGFVTHQYSVMKSEYQRRRRIARTPAAIARVESIWAEQVKAAQAAFSEAGLRASPTDLDAYATALHRNKANFNAVVAILNSARAEATEEHANRLAAPVGNFVTVYEKPKLDGGPIVVVAPSTLCERPITGVTTRHFSRSFSLKVKIKYWCPKWSNPFRTCTKTVTLAGVSFSVGLQIGYRITCCGATAWGVAYSQACGTVLGATVCASCHAKIVGTAGVGKSGSGSTCTYGLGITAELKCTVGGLTVFYAQVPIGWNVTGPCPPPNLPC